MIQRIIFALLLFCLNFVQAQKNLPEIGIAQPVESDSLVTAMGYRYLVATVNNAFLPDKISESEFGARAQYIKQLKTKLYAVNVFIPGNIKLVGPEVNESTILTYVETVFQKAKAADVNMIVWGSGGARKIPNGFDKAKAKDQFIDIARKVAVIAKKYKITLALENLNSTETNFINTLAEALDVVKKVDHPNFRLCADIYHMLKEGESASVIEQTDPYLVHCDLAEKENRAAPGVNKEDFVPYLKALKKVNYKGKIILECSWKDLSQQGKPALEYVQQQLKEAYR